KTDKFIKSVAWPAWPAGSAPLVVFSRVGPHGGRAPKNASPLAKPTVRPGWRHPGGPPDRRGGWMGALAPITILRSGGETSGEISGFSSLRRLPPLVPVRRGRRRTGSTVLTTNVG